MWDFGKMQQAIYAYAISKQTKMTEYTTMLAETTDQFWVSEFDSLWTSYERSMRLEDYYDDMACAIEAVSNTIHEFYRNPYNHPPSYTPVQVEVIDFDSITDSELESIVKKIEGA